MSKDTGLDVGELNEFGRRLLLLATEDTPKEAKKLLKRLGGKVVQIAKKNSQAEVGAKTGNYFKSWKTGKVFIRSSDGAYAIYAKNIAPHSHLIEYGHRMVTHDGREVGFARGKKILQGSVEQFNGEFDTQIDKWFAALVKKGMR